MAIYIATAIETGITVTDVLMPVLSSDERIDGETIFCFDYGNTDCWPGQNAAAALSAQLNIVPGGNAGRMVPYVVGGYLPFASGAFDLSGTNNTLEFGITADCDFSALGNAPFLFCLTHKPTDAGGTYRAYGANGSFAIHAGGGSPGAFIAFNGGTLNGQQAGAFDVAPNGVKTHWAISVVPNQATGTTKITGYQNGVQKVQTTVSGSTYGAATRAMQISGTTDAGYGTPQTKIYRAWMKRLDLIPGASTDAAILADVAADYALMTP